jgi:hypothetical protein
MVKSPLIQVMMKNGLEMVHQKRAAMSPVMLKQICLQGKALELGLSPMVVSC